MSVGAGEHFFAKAEILRRDFDQFVVGYEIQRVFEAQLYGGTQTFYDVC